jgi:phage baseplate assembly protein W
MTTTRSGSVHFPFATDLKNQSLQRAYTVEDVIASSIKAFLLTDPGSRRGNPVGSILPSLIHQLIPSNQINKFEEEIKQELVNQFPGISFQKVTLTPSLEQDVSSLKIGIIFSTPVTELSELTLQLS